jgi:hypothetical protein
METSPTIDAWDVLRRKCIASIATIDAQLGDETRCLGKTEEEYAQWRQKAKFARSQLVAELLDIKAAISYEQRGLASVELLTRAHHHLAYRPESQDLRRDIRQFLWRTYRISLEREERT